MSSSDVIYTQTWGDLQEATGTLTPDPDEKGLVSKEIVTSTYRRPDGTVAGSEVAAVLRTRDGDANTVDLVIDSILEVESILEKRGAPVTGISAVIVMKGHDSELTQKACFKRDQE